MAAASFELHPAASWLSIWWLLAVLQCAVDLLQHLPAAALYHGFTIMHCCPVLHNRKARTAFLACSCHLRCATFACNLNRVPRDAGGPHLHLIQA